MASKSHPHPEALRAAKPRRTHDVDSATSSDAAFEADGEELLRLDREFHRQLLQHFLAEAVDDQRQRVLGAETALAAIEQLVIADLRGGGLVLDAGGGVAHLDIGH